jgi:hypothetical protein
MVIVLLLLRHIILFSMLLGENRIESIFFLLNIIKRKYSITNESL